MYFTISTRRNRRLAHENLVEFVVVFCMRCVFAFLLKCMYLDACTKQHIHFQQAFHPLSCTRCSIMSCAVVQNNININISLSYDEDNFGTVNTFKAYTWMAVSPPVMSHLFFLYNTKCLHMSQIHRVYLTLCQSLATCWTLLICPDCINDALTTKQMSTHCWHQTAMAASNLFYPVETDGAYDVMPGWCCSTINWLRTCVCLWWLSKSWYFAPQCAVTPHSYLPRGIWIYHGRAHHHHSTVVETGEIHKLLVYLTRKVNAPWAWHHAHKLNVCFCLVLPHLHVTALEALMPNSSSSHANGNVTFHLEQTLQSSRSAASGQRPLSATQATDYLSAMRWHHFLRILRVRKARTALDEDILNYLETKVNVTLVRSFVRWQFSSMNIHGAKHCQIGTGA